MSSISMDPTKFGDGLKNWKTAMNKVDNSSKEGKMKLKGKGSDAEFITNYINAVKETGEVLQAYYNLLKKDLECMSAIQETMELADEAVSKALQNK